MYDFDESKLSGRLHVIFTVYKLGNASTPVNFRQLTQRLGLYSITDSPSIETFEFGSQRSFKFSLSVITNEYFPAFKMSPPILRKFLNELKSIRISTYWIRRYPSISTIDDKKVSNFVKKLSLSQKLLLSLIISRNPWIIWHPLYCDNFSSLIASAFIVILWHTLLQS